MPDVRISALPTADAAEAIDLAGVQGGVTKKLPASLLVPQTALDQATGSVARRAAVADARLHVARNDASDGYDGFSWGSAKASLAGAIAALPATGGVIEVGGGTYDLSAPTLVNKPNVLIRCAGIDDTIIRLAAGSFAAFGNSWLLRFHDSIGGALSDCTIDGNMRSGGGAVNQGGGVACGDHFLIERVRFYDLNYFKLYMSGREHVAVRQCRWETTGGGNDNIGGGTSKHVLIEDCHFASDIVGNPIDLVHCEHVAVRDCDVDKGTIYLEGWTDSTVENNRLVGSIQLQSAQTYAGQTEVRNPRNNKVRGNTLRSDGSTPYGIGLRYDNSDTQTMSAGGGNVIADNFVEGYNKVGILKYGTQTGARPAPQNAADHIYDNTVVNPNSDGTNTYVTGYGTVNNAGIAVRGGRRDRIHDNQCIDTRAVPLMQYGISLGVTSSTDWPVFEPSLRDNSSVGHTVADLVSVGGATLVQFDAAERIFRSAVEMGKALGVPNIDVMTTNRGTPVWMLDPASAESVEAQFILPPTWKAAHVDLWWSNRTASAGDVVIRADRGSLVDTVSIDTGETGGTQMTVAAPAQYITKVTRLVTAGSFDTSSARILRVEILRLGADAADTLAQDMAVIGVMLTRAA